MTFASDMQSLASSLLTEFGRAVTFSRYVEGEYNPMSSETGAGTATTYSAVAYPYPYNINEIDNQLILKRDIKLITYTTALPLVGDTVTLDTVVHRVMGVDIITAQSSNVVYELQLRI